MNICDDKTEITYTHPNVVNGHLYARTNGLDESYSNLYICCNSFDGARLFCLESGQCLSYESTFGTYLDLTFEDVTDQYCLQKVK